MDINLPDVHADLSAVFARYEEALVGNDLDTLDALFWPSPYTVRYGATENLVGIDAIRAFRAGRSPAGLARTLQRTVITTFGRDVGTTMTEFTRPAFAASGQAPRVGRQSQTWCRTDGGWRVVAAHVSVIPLAGADAPIESTAPASTWIEVGDARPYAYAFPRERTAVVVIDMQRDFLEKGGFGAMLGNDVGQLAAVAPRCADLLAWARGLGLMIVHTQEAHAKDLADCPPSKRARGHLAVGIGDRGPLGRILVEGEPGSDFVADARPLPGETVLRKPGKGAFHATGFEAMLRAAGITHLLLAGVTTEVCVQTSMREANDRGFECLIVEDCTGSYFPEFKRATIEMLVAQGGIVGWAAPLQSLVDASRR